LARGAFRFPHCNPGCERALDLGAELDTVTLEAMVNIKNKSRQMIVFNLPYQIIGDHTYCERQLRAKVVQLSDGQVHLAPEHARLSKSITLRAKGKPGDVVQGLPERVVLCPEVKAALDAGLIAIEKPKPAKVHKHKAASPAPVVAEPAPEAVAKKPSRKGGE
jgi:hypothetical protein